MTTHHHFFSIRLPGWQRRTTYLVLAALAGSGIAWSLSHDVLHAGWMLAERRLLVVHGVAAAAALVIVGGLLPLHIRLAWRVRRNLASGITAVFVMCVLAVTGLLLYYGNEEWRDWTRWTHIGVGVGGTVAIPLHIWLGRRRKALQTAQMKSRMSAAEDRRFTA